jgi:hypothetical protein
MIHCTAETPRKNIATDEIQIHTDKFIGFYLRPSVFESVAKKVFSASSVSLR